METIRHKPSKPQHNKNNKKNDKNKQSPTKKIPKYSWQPIPIFGW